MAVQVEGYRELMRSFALIQNELRTGLRGQIAEAVQPARDKAEGLAIGSIKNIGDRWSRMRIGITTTAVYLAPKARRRGGSPRPNLGPLLMKDSMLPAVEEALPAVRQRLEGWLDQLGEGQGF